MAKIPATPRETWCRMQDSNLRPVVYKTSGYFWDCPKCKEKNFGDSTDCWLCMTAQPAPDAPAQRFDDHTKGGTEEKRK